MDTRAYRIESYSAFTNGSFEVDMEVINTNKTKVFEDILKSPKPHCPVVNVSLDFLDEEKVLATELKAPFDVTKPSLFVAEGLIMYLGKMGKTKLLRDVSTVAGVGSVFILQFMDPSQSEYAKTHPEVLDDGLSEDEARDNLSPLGWGEFEFFKYGDESLNYGRFPLDRFSVNSSFRFMLAKKVSNPE